MFRLSAAARFILLSASLICVSALPVNAAVLPPVIASAAVPPFPFGGRQSQVDVVI
jgi:hypothetical protein